MQGYEFTAETLGHPPYTLCEVNANGRIDHIERIVGDLWHGILELKFYNKTFITPDRYWGNLEENGSWSGMIGGLIENRTQIAVASFYKSHSRMQVITLSESIA